MTAVWRQRWQGALGGTPPADALPGLWQAATAIDLNGRSVEAGEYLMPTAAGRWIWQHGKSGGEGHVAEGALPPQRVVASLLELGRRLRPDTGPTPIGRWLETPVVLLRAAEILQEPDLVQLLVAKLPHLAEVFRQPASRLTVDQELLPVGRARRVPARALGHLAAHPEEWEASSLVRVVPRRIVAEVREEELAIYENRVAVRLVDELLKFLESRIRDLTALVHQLELASNFTRDLVDSDYRRSERLSHLWAELHVDGGWAVHGQEQLAKTQGLRRHLLKLQDTTLYAAIAARSAMPSDVRQTNLFRDHRQYRDVFALWVAWRAHRRAADAKRAALDPQELCRAVEAFAVLCTVRALDQDGFVPTCPDALMEPGVVVTLEHDASQRTIQLRWATEGEVVLQILPGASSLCLVAVPTSFATAGPPDMIRAKLLASAPQRHDKERAEHRALLHVEPGDSWTNTLREEHWLPMVDRGPLDPDGSALPWSAVPISPWAIDSVERIGRLIHGWIWSVLEPLYPMATPEPRVADVRLPAAIQAGGGRWTAVAPGVVDVLDQLQRRRDSDAQAAARYEEQRSVLRSQRENLERQRELRKKIDELHVQSAAIVPAIEWLQSVRGTFAWIASCPGCGEAAFVEFEPRDMAFAAVCGACGMAWGVARLACGHRVPYAGKLAEFPVGREAVERHGRDVLAQRVGDRWGCVSCG